MAQALRGRGKRGAATSRTTAKPRGRFDHDVFKTPRLGSLRAALVHGAPLSDCMPWPWMGEDYAHVLMPGGDTGVTWSRLEHECLFMLTEMIVAVTKWRWSDPDTRWTIGDHAMLILETTAAKGASLYTQIWSEPLEPVAWEVSSGRANPGAKPFIDGDPATRIEAMGFAIGGPAENFRKEVPVLNRGDALAMARGMLRIFYDAFSYRGATPLVVQCFRQRRSRGDATVHAVLTTEDAQKLLRSMGFEAEAASTAPAALFCSRNNIAFTAKLDVQQDGQPLYECLDLMAWVGQATDFEETGWMNHLNEVSRVARAAVDDEGTVVISTGIILLGGVTEVYLSNRIRGWFDTVAGVVNGSLSGTKKRKRQRRAPGSAGDDDEGRGRSSVPLVH